MDKAETSMLWRNTWPATPAADEQERGWQIHVVLATVISNESTQIHIVVPWKWFENLTMNLGETQSWPAPVPHKIPPEI